MTQLELHGYCYSVYTWIVRFVLLEKSVTYRTIDMNPFSETGHPAHPFGKVPLLIHDGFQLYETSAITRYLDAAFPEPTLQPADLKARARSDQIINIIDQYAYWPLVRQVASQGYFNPVFGLEVDTLELKRGLNAAPRILTALDGLIAEQGILQTGQMSLADVHLGPMISYFTQVPDGASLVKAYPQLSEWWTHVSKHPGFMQTTPDFP